jgi:hypothetical protein
MGLTRRRFAAQTVVTAVVLLAGVLSAVAEPGSGPPAAASAARSTVRPTISPSPTPSWTPPSDAQAQRRALKSTLNSFKHPAHEPWSRLLPRVPQGATITTAATPLSLRDLSRQFVSGSVIHSLRFDGYRRGVTRVMTIGQLGVIGQIWQFKQPTGAVAWYLAYTRANQPGAGSEFTTFFAVGHDGARGYLARRLDSAGYHFGVGIAIEGDMIVHVRLFSTSMITRGQIKQQLRQATRPVAKGIANAGLFGQAVNTLATRASIHA